MKKLFAFASIAGVLALLGFSKYKDVSKLKYISFAPGPKPFTFVELKNGFGKFVIRLFVTNPSVITIDIDKILVEAWYKGTYLGVVNLKKVVINASGKTPLALPIEIISSKLLPFAKDFLTTGKIPVDFKLAATIDAIGSSFVVPYEMTIDVKEALREYLKQTRPLLAKLL